LFGPVVPGIRAVLSVNGGEATGDQGSIDEALWPVDLRYLPTVSVSVMHPEADAPCVRIVVASKFY